MQTGQGSGVGVLAVDASRVAPDYSCSLVIPVGARIFAVGWHPVGGVLLMYSANPGPVEFSAADTPDQIIKLWFVPAERVPQDAPVGATYLGSVNVASDMVICVFQDTGEE